MKLKKYLFLLFFGTREPKKIHYLISPILLLVFIWLGIICYPNMLFAYSTEYENFKIHSTRFVSKDDLAVVLNKVNSKIIKSEIYSHRESFDVFLCDDTNWATFLNPFQRNIYFAWTNPISKNVIVLNARVDRDLCYSSYVPYTERPLSDVIAHEVCHVLQYQVYGFLKARRTDAWKIEGYADYIGIGKQFELDEAKKWIEDNKSENSVANNYRSSYIAVSYLMNKKNWTYTKLIESSQTLQKVLDEIENDN